MKKLLLIVAALTALCPLNGRAQSTIYKNMNIVATAPSGTCTTGVAAQLVSSTGVIYTCQSGTWGIVNGGGSGSGTVTAGATGQIAFYPSNGAAVNGNVATADSSGNVKTTSATAQKVVFFDNFQYADGPIVGQVSPTGQTWQVTGTQAANAQIVSHTLQYSPRTISGPLAFYAYVPNLGVNVYSYSATFTVNANPGGSGSPDSSCAFGMSIIGDPSNILNKLLHIGGSCSAASINWWDGTNHTPAYCSNLNYSSPMTVGNTYTITVVWDGANNVYEIGPHGESMACTDPNFATSGGPGFFAELAYNTTDYAFPTISNITVTSQGGTGLVADSVKAPVITGCLGCGAGGPAVADVSILGIGTQAPSAPLTLIVPLSSSSDAALIDASTSSANARLRLKSQSSGFDPGIILDENVTNPVLLYSCANGNYFCVDVAGTSPAYTFQLGNLIENSATGSANFQAKSTLANSGGAAVYYADRGNVNAQAGLHLRTLGTDFWVEGMNGNTAYSLTDSTNGHAIVSFPNNTMPAGALGGNATGLILGGVVTFGTLYSAAGTAIPSCTSGLNGAVAVVTDATSPTYRGTYTSGGTITTLVECNGGTTAWLTH